MTNLLGTVHIKCTCSHLLKQNYDRINVLFAAKLCENPTKTTTNTEYVDFDVYSTTPPGCERTPSPDFIIRLQKYVDDLCKEGCMSGITGEDSSYDSDYEIDQPINKHQDVSRTTSDTLAAEYADYVQTNPIDQSSIITTTTTTTCSSSPGYTARVEFALKLGYTERLVQAALQKLGPTPDQNELLAELIKLGAQRGNNNNTNNSVIVGGSNNSNSSSGGGGCLSSCDNSPTDSTLDVIGDLQLELNNQQQQQQQLRPIVIDGSNVAMSHGNKEIFSCRGIKICVDWFKQRGHKEITVFVPKWRKESPRSDNLIRDQEILAELEKERLLVFTPSRLIGGKRMVCYDDRYILKLASEIDGIVVSNDNYRDLCQESHEFRKVIEERILMYSFVNDRFMPPDDPLGRSGPTLDNFLRYYQSIKKIDPPPPPCPYGKKCTYGNKCKYNHPERGPLPHKSVTERLSEHAQRHLQARECDNRNKQPLSRTRSNIPPSKDNNLSQHMIVSKSRSVDNVGGSCTTYQQQQQTTTENLHKKLQRQLTLNPISDPRLLRRYLPPPQQQQQQQQTFLTPQNWEIHQHVTRIASAPDSYRAWPPPQQQQQHPHQHHQQQQQQCHIQRISSCSDPQLWPPPLWSQSSTPSSSTTTTSSFQEETRRKLHYHLAAIFPEEQVTQVMQMYPDETNPQKICAAILTMFPKT